MADVRRLLAIALILAALAACSDKKKDQRVSAQDDETTTTSTTAPPETTTTTTAAPAPVVTTTTAKPTTTTAKPTTTTTAIPADQARLTIVNEYPAAVIAIVNGVRYDIPKGGRKGPVGVKPRAIDGNDTMTLRRADDESCGVGDADGYFEPNVSYTLRLYASRPDGCGQSNYPGLSGMVDPGGKQV